LELESCRSSSLRGLIEEQLEEEISA